MRPICFGLVAVEKFDGHFRKCFGSWQGAMQEAGKSAVITMKDCIVMRYNGTGRAKQAGIPAGVKWHTATTFLCPLCTHDADEDP